MIRFDLRKNAVPFVKNSVLDLSTAVEHFVRSINGSTGTRIIENPLDPHSKSNSRKSSHATIHGFQWRHFGAKYIDQQSDHSGQGVDQLSKLMQSIKDNPSDRRLLLVSWNPIDSMEHGTTTSHRISQFYVNEGKLSCKFYHKPANESDVILNIATYAMLTHLIAKTYSLEATELIQTIGVVTDETLKECIKKLMIEYETKSTLFPTINFEQNFDPNQQYDLKNISITENNTPLETSLPCSVSDSGKKNGHHPTSEEYNYFKLIQTVLEKGRFKSDRTGTGTIAYFGPELEFSLADNTVPLLTTKRVFWRGVVEELLWFINGSTDSILLRDKGIHIWDGNGSKEFLQKIGLGHRDEGDLGPVYGFQWRHMGAKYIDKYACYKNQGYDQMKSIINNIKSNQSNKPLVLSAWNPLDIPIMALPPCHCLAEFSVVNDRLSCLMYQRSADIGLGVPFNIASYALLTHIIAKITNLTADRLVYTLGDAHIYKDHVEPLKEQLKRTPGEFPKINFRRPVENIDDIKYEDIELIGYSPQASICMKMSV